MCAVNGINRTVVTGHHACTRARDCLAPPFGRDRLQRACGRLDSTVRSCRGGTSARRSLGIGTLAIGVKVTHRLKLSTGRVGGPCSTSRVTQMRGCTRRLTGRGVANGLCALNIPCSGSSIHADICTVTASPVTCKVLTMSGLGNHTRRNIRGRGRLFSHLCLDGTHGAIARLLNSTSISSRCVYHCMKVAPTRLRVTHGIRTVRTTPSPVRVVVRVTSRVNKTGRTGPGEISRHAMDRLHTTGISRGGGVPRVDHRTFRGVRRANHFPSGVVRTVGGKRG